MTRPVEERFFEKVNKTEGCWNWKGAMRSNGYGQFRFKGRPWKAHRVSWILANGEIPIGKVIAHSCDNRRCVRPDHLIACLQKENIQDMWRKGRNNPNPKQNQLSGESHPCTHLTDVDVAYIRSNYRRYQHPGLHHRFGVSRVVIHNIVKNKTWRYTQHEGNCEVV